MTWCALLLVLLLAGCGGGDDADKCERGHEVVALPAPASGAQPVLLVRCK